ncbi:MAG TPA: hypothetical protein DD440_06700 [Porticoccaceae bacterium]|nr:hypothetical protein [Porticoccaceae bacterium]
MRVLTPDLAKKSALSPFTKGFQHQLKFQAILSEASQLFNWQGSRATTLGEIAGALGLTKTCLYHYVKTKDDLIYQCYLASCDMWLATAHRSNQSQGSGLEKVVCMVEDHFHRFVKTLKGESACFAMLTEVSALTPAHGEEIRKRWKQIFGCCQSMVEEGMADGSIAKVNPKVVTLAIFSVLQWSQVWFDRRHASNATYIIGCVVDILAHGMAEKHHQFASIRYPNSTDCHVDHFDKKLQNQMKREAFYRVGAQHFNYHGYKGTSLDGIATALHVTKGAFYHHISSKEELLYQCFKRSIALERGLLLAAGKTARTGLARLELALRYLLHVQHSDQGPLIRYRALPSLDEQHRKDILKNSKENSALLGGYINEGVERGSLRGIDAEVAQHLLSGAIEASPDLSDHVPYDNGLELAADYLGVFVNGLSVQQKAR